MNKKALSLGVALGHLDPLAGDPLLALAHRLSTAVITAEAQGLGSGVHGGRVALTPDSFSVEVDGSLVLRPGSLSQDNRPGYRTWSAPEQLGQAPEGGDVRAWLFSLGAILYEAATGDALFETDSPPGVQSLVTSDLEGHILLTGVRGRLRQTAPDLLSAVLSTLVADPAERPADASSFLAAIPAASIDGNHALDALLRAAREAEEPPAPESIGQEESPPTPPLESEALGGQSYEVSIAPRGTGTSAPSVLTLSDRPAPEEETGERETLRSTMATAPATNSRVRPQSELGYRVRSTGGKIVRWGLGLLVLLLLLFGTTWFGFVPHLPQSLATSVESTGSSMGEALPPAVRGFSADLWAHRSDRFRGYRLWDGMVEVLPANMQVKYRRAVDPRARLTWPGEPVSEGIIGPAHVTLEPAAATTLTLVLSHSLTDAALAGALTWTATPVADPREPELSDDLLRVEGEGRLSRAQRTPVSGSGPDASQLPPGFWDVSLNYQESSVSGAFTGAIRGVRVAPGHGSTYEAAVTVEAGTLAIAAQVDGEPADTHALVTLYSPADGDSVRRAERVAMQASLDAGESAQATSEPLALPGSDPLWSGPLTEIPALPSGPVTARVAVVDGVHHTSVGWLRNAPVPGGGQTLSKTVRLLGEEALDPVGPGVRIKARNLSHDVSRHCTVYLFAPGSDVAKAQGRAGVFLSAEPGPYDVRVVYEPPAAGLGVRGEKVVASFMVAEEGISESTLDIGFPAATVRVNVTEDGKDVSEEVEIRIMRGGADPLAGTSIVDETEVGEHVVPAETYDIYLARSTDGKAPIDAVFPGIQLAPGDVWERELDVADHPWAKDEPQGVP